MTIFVFPLKLEELIYCICSLNNIFFCSFVIFTKYKRKRLTKEINRMYVLYYQDPNVQIFICNFENGSSVTEYDVIMIRTMNGWIEKQNEKWDERTKFRQGKAINIWTSEWDLRLSLNCNGCVASCLPGHWAARLAWCQ